MRGAVVLVAVLAMGCAQHSQVMVAPDGRTVTCQSHGGGLIGVAHAGSIQRTCLDAQRAAGFLEIERVGSIGIHQDEGRRIIKVVPGGPADSVGIRQGDIIVAVSGQPVTSREQVHLLLWGPPGEAVVMTVERAGERMEHRVVRRPFPEVHGQAPPPSP